ncbi:hypothetical protein [Telluribacter humicola]|uniref:hypothetical protein n=1 Tax=Telluribacter humicola TaxID=1720261 RepID=UPI001A97AF91|nr:hypothetical protein [Telluribacter humicola]
MKPEYHFDIKVEGDTLTIREGKALELKEPQSVVLKGVLDTPLVWLQKRIGLINQHHCHIKVDRHLMIIVMFIEERDHYQDVITGMLEYHPKFLEFGINSGKYKSHFEMADFFKMNRSFFENFEVASKLVSDLRNFKAKVSKEVEKSDDNRGNISEKTQQIVESNLPEAFKLNLPIFKGTDRQTIEVEVYIRASDFCCTLISPQANDIIEQMRDSQIDQVLKEIRELAPDIAIIEC